jgi:hypothetical protein
MSGIIRERCGNCAAFEPLSQEVLEKYKNDPRVKQDGGTCSKGPFLRHPYVNAKDKCNPLKLESDFELWVEGASDKDLKTSRFEPRPGQDSIGSLLTKLHRRLDREIYLQKRKRMSPLPWE